MPVPWRAPSLFVTDRLWPMLSIADVVKMPIFILEGPTAPNVSQYGMVESFRLVE